MKSIDEIKEVEGPIMMLNMLRFRDRRLYIEEYLPAFKTVTEKLGFENVKVELLNDVIDHVIADKQEHWDAILLVEYPAVSALKTIAVSKEYAELAAPIREAALDQWKLYMTRKVEK